MRIISGMPSVSEWALPVGEPGYPPASWYVAQGHNPAVHTGIDINLDEGERGDIERRLGLSVFAITSGVVTHVAANWYGVGMVVVQHEHAGERLWVRYAHITPCVTVGSAVSVGDKLGPFANWRTGDHLHFDMAHTRFTTEWLARSVDWVDPGEVLREHIDPDLVDSMYRVGD